METNQFSALPLKAFTPAGWTRRQLEIQAAGLSGQLDEFWPDIKDSGWIGGNAEAWERAPYWLDGLVPLAYLLADSRLIRKVTRWMDYILEHQHQDGWLGPAYDVSEYRKAYDPWPQFIILKVLSQYREVSGDSRVISAMVRNIRKIISVMKEKPLESWAKYRWAELLVSLRWLDGRPGVPADVLREAAKTVRDQGFDWPGLFRDFPYTRRTAEGETSMETHVVNNAMALKGPALAYLYSGDIRDAENSLMMIEVLDNHHGQITGMFTGDEHLAGKNPSQGTELCAVTEYLFSLEILIQILGSSGLGDRLEKIAFNALPAAFRDDMDSHQYDQQVNQVICTVSENKIYTTNSGDANIFGLEPNYGCCTANMHQGWPKFISHSWLKAPDGGLVCVSPVPLTLKTTAGSDDGKTETIITVSGDYPFSEKIRIGIDPEKPALFPLVLRVPGWCGSPEIWINGGDPVKPNPGEYHKIIREWRPGDAVTMKLPMRLKMHTRFNSSAALTMGPLVYSHNIEGKWQKNENGTPCPDWEARPVSPWNFGLILNPDSPESSCTAARKPSGPVPFSSDFPPSEIRCRGVRIPGWGISRNAAEPPPEKPFETEGQPQELVLVPYGCAKLRVTEMPVISEDD